MADKAVKEATDEQNNNVANDTTILFSQIASCGLVEHMSEPVLENDGPGYFVAVKLTNGALYTIRVEPLKE